MKIGITGGKGFIGNHLAQAFKKEKYQVSLFDLPENNLLFPKEDNLKKFVQKNDIIIHTAGVNRGNDSEIIAGNIVTSYNLISAMEKYKSRAKLIFISSIQVETGTLFGRSKELVEIMLKDFSSRTKMPVTILRLTNIFGENCRPFYNSVVATFCHQVVNGNNLLINNPNKKINFVYVGDLIKVIKQEVLNKRQAKFYFKRISSTKQVTVKKLAELIKSFSSIINTKNLKTKLEKDLYKTYLSYKK